MTKIEVPPFEYPPIKDPDLDVWYSIFSYERISSTEKAWSFVAKFLGKRKRTMPKTWQILPKVVKLIVQKDGQVTPHGLPTQSELLKGQAAENQKKKKINAFLDKKLQKNTGNHPGKLT